MSRTSILLAVVTIVGILCVSSWAQGNGALADENAQLKNRVETLEKQVQGLTSTLSPEDQQAVKASAEGKQPLWSKLDVQFYGYIKGDAAYDNSRTTSGNYMVWVDRENNRKNDDEFNLTANETRLGFFINGPKDDRMQTSGRGIPPRSTTPCFGMAVTSATAGRKFA